MSKFFNLIEDKITILLNKFIPTIYNDSPEPWQLSFQDEATPIMEGIVDLHNEIMFYMIVVISLVLWMLIRILILFGPYSSAPIQHIHHNTLLEIVWTITPAVILGLIAVPSFSLLYAMDEIIDPAITIKVIGHQWYWSYEYSDYNTPDDESIAFDSYMIADADLGKDDLRLLSVDNEIVIPINVHVRFIITSLDVIHSWAVPSLGIKLDAVPGRLSQVSTFVKREGTFYGQCSEICGINHGFMPIVVKATTTADYLSWLKTKVE